MNTFKKGNTIIIKDMYFHDVGDDSEYIDENSHLIGKTGIIKQDKSSNNKTLKVIVNDSHPEYVVWLYPDEIELISGTNFFEF